jgi:two-component system C4-dicarboxylate transport response regulator DctD
MEKSAGLRILVVEDEPLMRWSVAQALEAGGHDVMEAADGSSAKWALTHSPPADVVLLDYRLPDSTGLTLLEDIHRLAPAMPIVMMTAYGTRELSDRARELGACDVLNKPFDVFAVENVLRKACLLHA